MTVYGQHDALARQLADLFVRLTPSTNSKLVNELHRLTLFMIEQTQQGIIAIPLAGLTPPLALDLLHNNPIVGSVGEQKPIIISATHVWFYRYWRYEYQLSARLNERIMANRAALPEQLSPQLDLLFTPTTHTDWQKIAAALALHQSFMIISGGPGTGKTTTVTRILALLLNLPTVDPLRIQLAAPTGKAALRLQESIQKAQLSLKLSDSISQALTGIPTQTLHRLLGYRPASNEFSYHEHNLLPVDVLIIDEASMMDIALMNHVLAALPASARLILLGDKHQLAAVETGSVFRDLCADADNQFSPTIHTYLADLGINLPASYGQSGLNDHIVILQHSYRFDESSGIGQLAEAIKSAKPDQVHAVLTQAYADVEWLAGSGLSNTRLLAGWQDYFAAVRRGVVADCFAAFNQFRILSPVRQGKCGTETLNERIEQLARHQLPNIAGALRSQGWYVGRPIMVIKNDYAQHLFNGDIGIALTDSTGALRVYFPDTILIGQYRSIAPVRLPHYESAWAMTIHKSQGSEFEQVLLVMPDNTEQALLGRELLYTGVTRTRSALKLLASWEVLAQAIERSTPPSSRILESLACLME